MTTRARLTAVVAGLRRGAVFATALERLDGVELVAVCDRDPTRLAAHQGVRGVVELDDLLELDPDIVVIATPADEHAAHAMAALAAGAHVLCETPCACTAAEAEDLLRAARRGPGAFMLAEDYLWSSWTQTAKTLVARGALGDVVHAAGDVREDARGLHHVDGEPTWRARLPPLLYTSHTLAPLLHATHDRAIRASGFTTGCRTASATGAIDLEVGVLGTASGAIIELKSGFSVAHPTVVGYELTGTAGSLRLRIDDGATCLVFSEAEGSTGWTPLAGHWLDETDAESRVCAMLAAFVHGVSGGAPMPVGAERSLDFILPGIVAHESAMTGGAALTVPDPRNLGR